MPTTTPSDVIIKRGLAGLGLFTTRSFTRGEYIIEYTGELITHTEADRRGGKYLFTIDKNWIIDGKDRSNIARYINHACRPNAYAETDLDEQRIRIYAKKRIGTGEEITYHYGKSYVEDIIGSKCQCADCSSAH